MNNDKLALNAAFMYTCCYILLHKPQQNKS